MAHPLLQECRGHQNKAVRSCDNAEIAEKFEDDCTISIVRAGRKLAMGAFHRNVEGLDAEPEMDQAMAAGGAR